MKKLLTLTMACLLSSALLVGCSDNKKAPASSDELAPTSESQSESESPIDPVDPVDPEVIELPKTFDDAKVLKFENLQADYMAYFYLYDYEDEGTGYYADYLDVTGFKYFGGYYYNDDTAYPSQNPTLYTEEYSYDLYQDYAEGSYVGYRTDYALPYGLSSTRLEGESTFKQALDNEVMYYYTEGHDLYYYDDDVSYRWQSNPSSYYPSIAASLIDDFDEEYVDYFGYYETEDNIVVVMFEPYTSIYSSYSYDGDGDLFCYCATTIEEKIVVLDKDYNIESVYYYYEYSYDHDLFTGKLVDEPVIEYKYFYTIELEKGDVKSSPDRATFLAGKPDYYITTYYSWKINYKYSSVTLGEDGKLSAAPALGSTGSTWPSVYFDSADKAYFYFDPYVNLSKPYAIQLVDLQYYYNDLVLGSTAVSATYEFEQTAAALEAFAAIYGGEVMTYGDVPYLVITSNHPNKGCMFNFNPAVKDLVLTAEAIPQSELILR